MKKQIENYFDRLWPICRSITGNGLRQSLKILQEIIPLELHEVETGTQVFDWTVPKEWNINDAYIITPEGKKIADFKVNNLHIVNYSIPINEKMSFADLDIHLHSLPDMPTAIPYLTSYYKETWGFCLTQQEYDSLPKEGEYQVVIDSTLENGSLTYGDLVLKGETDEEILLSTYVCHPSLANNELSGPLATAFLYQEILKLPKRKYTYRFVFAPETIGIIAYLAKVGMRLKEKLIAGYVLTCVGDGAEFTYKHSKQHNSVADKIALHVLKNQNVPYRSINYAVGGSDERQYCSPGFDLPVGSLIRSMYHEYQQYHTSLDNKDFMCFESMEKTINTYLDIIRVLEINANYINAIPYCEPQLGKRGLYNNLGGQKKRSDHFINRLHLLSYADGTKDLIDIAEKNDSFALDFIGVVEELVEAELITEK
jgi:aminopeptidase-like protein